MIQGILRGVRQGGKKQQGPQRMSEAVRLYFDHPTLTSVQALKLADFRNEEAESRTKQKTLSKRRMKDECALVK
jgi:chromosome condensin MukBEF complex kleisin-like MukF subunit